MVFEKIGKGGTQWSSVLGLVSEKSVDPNGFRKIF
jgi:hypothetical protein